MEEGKIVRCISEDFPMIRSTVEENPSIGTQAKEHPILGVFYEISEVLGDFLRFDCLDTEETFRWWCKSRFRVATLEELLALQPQILGKENHL